jgi:hypothetical protein
MIWAAAKQILIGGERLAHAPEALQNRANAEQSVRVVRPQFEQFLKRIKRILRLAKALQHHGTRAERLGIRRPEAKRPIEPRQGAAQIVGVETDKAKDVARDVALGGEIGVLRQMGGRRARLACVKEGKGLGDGDLQ